MSVTIAHQHMHQKYCRSLGSCMYIKGTVGNQHPLCREFDEDLQAAEKEHTQSAAQKLLHMHAETLLTHGPGVAQGLALAYKHVAPDPYYKDPQS